MRIIQDWATEMRDADRVRGEPAYMLEDTIEITDDEWVAIISDFVIRYGSMVAMGNNIAYKIMDYKFPQYLRDLISLVK